ncbi:MAG: NAD-dependent epimerase/dehydratase family protein [Candidatus Heimdallarchaeota archaeon]
MKVLITGGTGFVGGKLIEELVAEREKWGIKKEEIYALVRETSHIDHLKKLGINLIQGDLTDKPSLQEAVKGKELLFHLGAVVLDQSDPKMLQKVNVEGTKNLVEAFKSEPEARKFVFISTWGVYGYKVKSKPMLETHPLNPTNDYHKSKVAAEQVLKTVLSGTAINLAIVRLPMILGPGDTLTTPRVIQAFFDKKVKMIGNGKNLFSAVHVKDAAQAILTVGFKIKGRFKIYNVKSFDISQKDYWAAHMKEINYTDKINMFPKWLAMLYAWTKEVGAKIKGQGKPTLSRHRVMRYGNTRILDITQIQKDFQWKPEFTDGIKVIQDTVQWLIENDFVDFEHKEVRLLRRWEDALKRKKNMKKS